MKLNKSYILRIYKGYFFKIDNKENNYLEIDINKLKKLILLSKILKNLKIKINNQVLLHLNLGKIEQVLL